MSPSHFNIIHLLRHGRHPEAEAAARGLLARDMKDSLAWIYLGRSLLGRRKYSAAEDAARQAITAAADSDDSHFLLAEVLLERNRPKEALPAAREAVRLNTEDSLNHALVARALNGLGRFEEAIGSASAGLRENPGCDVCLFQLSQANSFLGRHEEAGDVTRALLQDDPEDAANHSARGYHLLLAADPAGARRHFLEALRLQPDYADARHGLARSLTNRNPVFRLLLKFAVLCERWGWRALLAGFGVIFLLTKLPALTRGLPGAAPVTSVLLVAGVLFALAMLCHAPLASLLLLAHRETRNVVSRSERRGALWCLPILLIMLWSLGSWIYTGLLTGGISRWPTGVFMWAFLISLVSETHEAENPWVRRRMAWLSLLCATGITVSTVTGVMNARRLVRDFGKITLQTAKLPDGELKRQLREAISPALRTGQNLRLLEIAIILICLFSENIRAALEQRAPDPD